MSNQETLKTEYANNAIASIDERIAEAKEILAFLDAQRAAAVAFASTKPRWFYVVRSRSGGADHRIQKWNGDLFCSCKAGLSNRKCWALKGVQSDVTFTGEPTLQFFRDENFIRYYYGASTIGFDTAAAQNRRMW